MIYLELLWTFVQIGAFSFGGGYAVLPMIEKYVVQQQQWITIE
jgi:chromate transporter